MKKSGKTVRIRSQHNISVESAILTAEETLAHEAATLKVGNAPGEGEEEDEKSKNERGRNALSSNLVRRKKELGDRMQGVFAHLLVERNPLPEPPTTKDKVLQGCRAEFERRTDACNVFQQHLQTCIKS